MLLAKVHLNAQVYIGQDKYQEAATALQDVLNSSYQIAQVPYTYLFMADNHSNGAQNEIIFPIRFDGQFTTGGGTYYIRWLKKKELTTLKMLWIVYNM
ncbi:MAG: hypothetical protein EOO47_27205, partial [Flavobacterium sp.]